MQFSCHTWCNKEKKICYFFAGKKQIMIFHAYWGQFPAKCANCIAYSIQMHRNDMTLYCELFETRPASFACAQMCLCIFLVYSLLSGGICVSAAVYWSSAYSGRELVVASSSLIKWIWFLRRISRLLSLGARTSPDQSTVHMCAGLWGTTDASVTWESVGMYSTQYIWIGAACLCGYICAVYCKGSKGSG